MPEYSSLTAYMADFRLYAFEIEPAEQKRRSSGWEKEAKAYLADFPKCRYCRRDKGENVPHHIMPFHLFPKLELVRANLLTFCPECHLYLAHGGNYRDYNKEIKRIVDRLAAGIVRSGSSV